MRLLNIFRRGMLALVMVRTKLLYSWRFASMGSRCIIERPYRLVGARNIRLGHGVRIRAGARLEAFRPDGVVGPAPALTVGDGVSIGQDCHVICTESISIGRGSLLGARVSVIDSEHGAAEGEGLREMAPIRRAPVRIGERVWIGNGAVITAGVRIGSDATVGANAVVTRDVASGDIVGGVPARILRTAGTPRSGASCEL